MNKQKYSNNIGIKKIRGQRNKQATTKCSIKIADRQTSSNNSARTNGNKIHNKQFVYIYRDFAKTTV